MKTVFADAFYYLSLINTADASHERALALSRASRYLVVTTAWILTEVADALAAPGQREGFLALLGDLQADPDTAIVPPTQDLFEQGIRLYGQRLDKDWSLTDCISFVVMKQHGIAEALTGDRHFEQAGFNVLLK